MPHIDGVDVPSLQLPDEQTVGMPSVGVEVVMVTAPRLGDVETLFERDPVTASCWCAWPFSERGAFTPTDLSNRDALTRARVPGLLAYVDAVPAGWAAVGPRRRYSRYDGRADGEWVIACLFVGRQYRDRRVADSLVAAAVERAIAEGASAIEGPAPWWRAGSDASTEAVVASLLANEFVVVDGPSGAPTPTLRRVLPTSVLG